ncbi:hypothetical protein [Nostoc sp. C110]|uniref:hypothetical protein n=1 Tax=Nostoc sp. C110 TaxID=3349876 RepID=UPI00370D8B95
MTPLQRRQFGKLVAAGLTSTVVADIYSKAVAQSSSSPTLYGIKFPNTSKTRNREDQSPSVEVITAQLPIVNLISAIVVEGLKVLSQVPVPILSVDNLLPVPKKPQAFFLPESDRITKAILLADKTLVISTVSNTKNGNFNFIIYSVGNGFKSKRVLDFKTSNQTVESFLSLPNNQFLCLVGTGGVPPFSLRTLDFTTGRILSSDKLGLPPLPPNHRFANLCLGQGNIYATETGSEGIPVLISINLEEKAILTGNVKIKRLTPLKFKGVPLVNDVKDLAFFSGQLYALATDSSRKNNVLFKVDVKTGNMEPVTNLAAEKITFSA